MTSKTPPSVARLNISASVLLGLRDPTDAADWGVIRAAQLRAGSKLTLFMLAANVIGAALMVLNFAGGRPWWQLASWAALVAAIGTTAAFRRLSARHRITRSASLQEVRSTAVDGIALGLIWSIVPIAFQPGAGTQSLLGMTIILAILMVSAAVSMAALPLASIAFLVVLGCAQAACFAFYNAPALGAASLLLTALLITACLTRARAMLIIRAQQLTLAERDETVSLLLHEFEDQNADWLWETDVQRRITSANPRFATSLGLDPGAINGMPFLQLLAGSAWTSGNFAQGLHILAEQLKNRESFRDILLPVVVDGEERWWRLTGSPRTNEDGQFVGFRGVGSDVTEERRSADKINRMARYDTLTGLPNRLFVNETLANALDEATRYNRRCAFMMIDLDRFKAVNDTLGHQVGDRLLVRVADRLRQLMTQNEMIGRLGGDEFAVVVRDATDRPQVEQLARTIIDVLSAPYEVDQNQLFIGASVGLAVAPRDGRTADMLIRSADLALYRSKDVGGGHVHVYEPQLHADAEERRVLEIALRAALENEELTLMYQPVVDTANGMVMGFEALIRWHHPEFGAIPPSKFVPLAEEARLIAPIGEWVLNKACREAAQWDSHMRLCVNISPDQLHSGNFAAMVAAALKDSGFDPDRLELEVTEGVFMREGTTAVQTLKEVLKLGVRLSLDDFGTGYSSLAYLSRTRFSTIKIDPSFVRGASTGKKEAIAIIRAVVALAQSLDMATTAEGVETEDEYHLVRTLGCSRVQGYHFGRPLPVEEARDLAMRHGGTDQRATG